MARFSKNQVYLVSLALIVIVTAAFFLYNHWVRSGTDFSMKKDAPEFEFTNLQGETVSLNNTDGKVRLIYFYFSHCTDVCPVTTYLLSGVQELLKERGQFGNETQILSITFDPARDTTERLREFSARFNADASGWQFLRGEEQYSRDVAMKYGISVLPADGGQFAHQNIIFLVDRDGYIREYIYDTNAELTPEQILETMEPLL